MSKIIKIQRVGIPFEDAEYLVELLKRRMRETQSLDAKEAFRESANSLRVLIDILKRVQK